MGINSFKLSRWWSILKRGRGIKDSVALGAVGGLLGTVAMVLSNTLIYKAGKTEIRYGHIAGSIFMSPIRTRQRKNFILGQLFHFITGSGAGLVMVQIGDVHLGSPIYCGPETWNLQSQASPHKNRLLGTLE